MIPDSPADGAPSGVDTTEEDRPTVLAVDDDEDLADTYAIWLDGEYDVRTTYDGESAIDAVDSDVDVVLLDRRMPDMSGGDVLDAIREQGYDVRVSMLTAVEPDEDILEMPFDEYLVKPVTRDDVVDTVENLLARSEYDDDLQEYFAVSAKLATLEAELTPDERNESAAYQDLQQRKVDLEARVQDSLDDVEGFEDAFREVEN
ncbi:HalX domain-containing protein [Halarchaeum sp. CBA1220]|uniref:HalX domain-containing protein n=1 Tax=Halarchaeum sp. CBA1220 TaxID=1853682 RepID=UPI000F3A8CB6|nr:HalX domain-containing protein [Halarchaeum sp. CBA1220]QLC33971.1 HalX domain-containing protein [Halarchaeum sp. CBA1220]